MQLEPLLLHTTGATRAAQAEHGGESDGVDAAGAQAAAELTVPAGEGPIQLRACELRGMRRDGRVGRPDVR